MIQHLRFNSEKPSKTPQSTIENPLKQSLQSVSQEKNKTKTKKKQKKTRNPVFFVIFFPLLSYDLPPGPGERHRWASDGVTDDRSLWVGALSFVQSWTSCAFTERCFFLGLLKPGKATGRDAKLMAWFYGFSRVLQKANQMSFSF